MLFRSLDHMHTLYYEVFRLNGSAQNDGMVVGACGRYVECARRAQPCTNEKGTRLRMCGEDPKLLGHVRRILLRWNAGSYQTLFDDHGLALLYTCMCESAFMIGHFWYGVCMAGFLV